MSAAIGKAPAKVQPLQKKNKEKKGKEKNEGNKKF